MNVDPGEHLALLQFLYQVPTGLARLNPNGDLEMANPTAMQLCLQVAPGCLNLYELLNEHAPEVELIIEDFAADRGHILEDYRVDFGRRTHTAAHALVVSLTVIKIGPGQVLVVMSDVSRSVATERAARAAERKLRALSDGVRDHALVPLDREGRVEGWSGAAQRLFGFEAEDVVGWSLQDLGGNSDFDPQAHLTKAGAVGWTYAEGWWRRRTGGMFWGTMAIFADEAGFTAVIRDQSQALVAPEVGGKDLDPSSGALRRESFDRLRHRLDEALAASGGRAGILLIEVDGIEEIERKGGLPVVELAIAAAAARVREQTRPADTLVRYGKGQLLVLLRDAELADARAVAERIRTAQEQTVFTGSGAPAKLTVSGGVASLSPMDPAVSEAIERAEQALALAHERGDNQIVLGHRRAA